MTLAPGVRLGPYEVVGALGAGGMGEVYRATDTRLDRTVAVKVLPSHVAADPAVRERFEREARAVGGLSHPNICTLHDVGRQRPAVGAAGPDESAPPVDFLVMECLDGETLARRLERGALPPDEALRVAGDIAEALDAAHRRGIVHRDLKPGNVMLASSGVKLLDFGLARLREPGALDDDPSGAPTSAALTAEGSLLGTLQYMSPEQLDGKPAATVERFVIEVGEGQELGGQLALSPDGRRLVYVVLEDGATRFYLRDLDAFTSAPIAGTEGIDAGLLFFSPDGRDVGFGRIVAGENWTLNRIPAAGGTPREIVRVPGQLSGAVWRPDGTIVFGVLETGLARVPAAGGDVQFLTRVSERPGVLGHAAPVALAGREEIIFQNRQRLGGRAAVGAGGLCRRHGTRPGGGRRLRGVSRVGALAVRGARRRPDGARAGSRCADPRTASRSRYRQRRSDGLVPVVNQSFAGATRALIRPPDDGRLRTLTWVDRAGNEEPLPLDPAVYRVARLSPDGRRIALDRGRQGERDLWVFDLERDTLSPLFLDAGDDESPVWTPDGRQIVFTSGRDGLANLHLRAADGTGPVERLSTSSDLQWPQSWSPDGRTLVFSRRVRTGPAAAQTLDTMMMRLDADRAVTPLLATEFTESNPAVSPDGRWIAYRSDESGRNEVVRAALSRSGGAGPDLHGRRHFAPLVFRRRGALLPRGGRR